MAFCPIKFPWLSNLDSAVLAAEMIWLHAESGEVGRAEVVVLEFGEHGPETAFDHVANTRIDVLIDHGTRRCDCSGNAAVRSLARTKSMLQSRHGVPGIPVLGADTLSRQAVQWTLIHGPRPSSLGLGSDWLGKRMRSATGT